MATNWNYMHNPTTIIEAKVCKYGYMDVCYSFT